MNVFFEDTHLIILSKPSGLLSQGDVSGDDNLVDRLRTHFGRNYVGLIHRLDRNTSGLMVIAKRSKSAERLTSQLQDGRMQRKYSALLLGAMPLTPKDQPILWKHSLLKNESTNEVKVVTEGTPGAKPAVLNVCALKHVQRTFKNKSSTATLAKFSLETGRSHQIRVQSAAMGFPILGDQKYGGEAAKLFDRPALHSCELSFLHPMSGESMAFTEENEFI